MSELFTQKIFAANGAALPQDKIIFVTATVTIDLPSYNIIDIRNGSWHWVYNDVGSTITLQTVDGSLFASNGTNTITFTDQLVEVRYMDDFWFVTYFDVAPGGGVPGGANGDIQYNNAGAFGGITGFSFSGGLIAVIDNIFTIVDNGDVTKKLAFECANITSASTRTITMVNFSGTQVLSSGGLTNTRVPYSSTIGLIDLSTFVFSIPATLSSGSLGVGTSSANATLNLGQTAAASGAPILMEAVAGSHTNLTASTEVPDVSFRLQRTVQFATGAKTTQRAFVVTNPTYSAVGATTTTDASTFEVSGAPVAGTNMTITRSWAARILGNTAIGTKLHIGSATGVIVPTALLHLGAGTTAAATAPLKFTTGTSMTTAEAGAVEMTTDDLFFTITTGAARKRLAIVDTVGGLTSGRVPVATTNGRLFDSSNFTYLTNRLSPTYITLAAGTATAGTGPLIFTTGTSLTTAVAGAMEFTTDNLFFTITTGTARKRIMMADPVGGLTAGRISFTTTNGRQTDDANLAYTSGTGLLVGDNIKMITAGNGLYVKEGTNATMGVATLVAGTVTVNTTKVTATSRIFLTRQNTSGTLGASVDITARVAATSFTITSQGSILDTSDVAWVILEPA